VFQCTAPSRQTALIERFSPFFAHFLSMKTFRLLIAALQSCAMVWVEQRKTPTAASLDFLENRLGDLIL
jgi:hypothetical protein